MHTCVSTYIFVLAGISDVIAGGAAPGRLLRVCLSMLALSYHYVIIHDYLVLICIHLVICTVCRLNIAAAVEVARKLGPGHTVATIICDSGLVCRCL